MQYHIYQVDAFTNSVFGGNPACVVPLKELFSDGFQDQFGGEKGRKYMKRRFKKFILSIQAQDMQTQLYSFEKEFNLWKGDREQIDDVCVMGVRIT